MCVHTKVLSSAIQGCALTLACIHTIICMPKQENTCKRIFPRILCTIANYKKLPISHQYEELFKELRNTLKQLKGVEINF